MDNAEKNRSVLQEVRPKLYEKLIEREKEQQPSFDSFEKTETRDGNWALCIKKDGKVNRMNSTYRPAQEAKKWADQFTFQNMNIITIFLGISVGATTSAQSFLNLNTIKIVVLGLIAFCLGTAGGTLFGKLMYIATKGKVNPLIGSAGVSAVPMAARVSQKVGQKENPSNFLLMHAMGPNVSGVIGSAVAAGILLTLLK